jgi:hypothetical protein
LNLLQLLPRSFRVLKPSEKLYVCFPVDNSADLLLVEKLGKRFSDLLVLTHLIGHFNIALRGDEGILALLHLVDACVNLLLLLPDKVLDLVKLLVNDVPRLVVQEIII